MNLINDKKYAIVMLIFSLIYCFSAYSLDATFDPTLEKFYPFALAVVMVGLSVALFIFPSVHSVTWPRGGNLMKICITFAAILIYCFVLHAVGFLISASVLMGTCMWVFEAKRKWIIPTSIISTISFYVVFDRILGLNLPAGILDFF
jgi:hypothetical protein